MVSSSWSYMAAHGINLHCWSAGGRKTHTSIYLHVNVEWTNGTVQRRELYAIQWSFKHFRQKDFAQRDACTFFVCQLCHHVCQWHGESLFGDVLYFLCFHPIFCMLAEFILSKNTTTLMYIIFKKKIYCYYCFMFCWDICQNVHWKVLRKPLNYWCLLLNTLSTNHLKNGTNKRPHAWVGNTKKI